MATFTAQILVGSPHPNHGGINPTHSLFLSENSRPAWILVDPYPDSGPRNSRIVWIPTLENMLEDALLMIAVYVCKDDGILVGLTGALVCTFTPVYTSLHPTLHQELADP